MKIINIEKIEKWDYITISIHLFLTFFVANPNLTNFSTLFYSFYSISTLLFLYIFNYKSLRKIKVYLIWIGISIFHLYIFLKLGDDQNLQMYRGSALDGLKLTWIALVLYQIFRILSIHYFKIELVCPTSSGIDLWDNRIVKWSDKIFFILYFILLLLFFNLF